MASTIDKFLGRPLNHHHTTDDIIGYTEPIVSQTVTVTTNASAGTEDTILANASNNTIAITLPQSNLATNKIYKIKKIDSSVNVVTIYGNGTETIDGDTSLTIAYKNSAVQIVSNGSGWYIV